MSGSRRTQRSVRLTLATVVVAAAGLVVAIAVVASRFVSAAAILAVLAGAVATRIGYAEVAQTRRDAAVRHADQARSFQESSSKSQAEQLASAAQMAGRLSEQDAAVGALSDRLGLAQRRAADAELRVRRETRRANEAQERLAALLDEVLGTSLHDVDIERQGELRDLPSVIELLGRETRVHA